MEWSLVNETQQMPLLCKRDPVPWTHTRHHRHQITTIENSSHQQHAPTKNSLTGMSILRTCQILQEVHQGLCKDGHTANLINPTQGQV